MGDRTISPCAPASFSNIRAQNLLPDNNSRPGNFFAGLECGPASSFRYYRYVTSAIQLALKGGEVRYCADGCRGSAINMSELIDIGISFIPLTLRFF